LALCLTVAATAYGQSPRDDSGDDPGRGEQRRARRGDDQSDAGPRGRGEDAPRGRGEDGGRFGGRDGEPGGPGGPGGFFRRSNPMFEAIDTDGDQMISPQELKKAIAGLKKLDADGDGSISLAEASPQGGRGAFFGGDPAQMVDRMFEQNDKNGDGKLTEDELDPRMAGMLRNADENGDGAIDKEELTKSMENMRNRFGGPGGPGGQRGGFGGPGGGFDAGRSIQQFDRNGDGMLSPQEVPPQMQGMLRGGDTNNDGMIDRAEMQAIGQRMSERFGGRGGPGGQEGYGRGDRGGDNQGDQGGDQNDRRSRRNRPEADE
jgi:Ca2+-binding EF-hand superfamily protein